MIPTSKERREWRHRIGDRGEGEKRGVDGPGAAGVAPRSWGDSMAS